LQCVLRLETLDEIDKIASFHKSGDDDADSLRRPGYDSEFLLCSWFVVCSSGLGRLRLHFDFNSLVQ